MVILIVCIKCHSTGQNNLSVFANYAYIVFPSQKKRKPLSLNLDIHHDCLLNNIYAK